MRQVLLLSSLAVAAAACGGGSSSAGSGGGAATSPTPASAPAATSTAPAAQASAGGANPCAGGSCRIVLEFDQSIAPELQRKQAVYKIYKGCLRTYGVQPGTSSTDASGFRAQAPLTQSSQPMIVLPSFEGTSAIVAIFMGTQPHKYIVVDFSKGSNQTAKLPYAYTAAQGSGALAGAQLEVDQTIDRTNAQAARRICTG